MAVSMAHTPRNLIGGLAALACAAGQDEITAFEEQGERNPVKIRVRKLPLSVPFALLTLAITGHALNLWSTLGILLLLGIVKKNSILQVDYTNVLRRRGVPLGDALVEASRTRLRPILMTTIAIIAGLVPTAFGTGAGARQRGDIAMTIIGGQTLCLFLTLLLVPVTYSLAEDARERMQSSRVRAWIGRMFGRGLETAPDETA
jgi:multidrug efflux pump subunit AcrB